jgi:hypothetical protein
MTARWSGAVLGRNGGNAALSAAGLEAECWRVSHSGSAGSLQR